MLSVSSTFGYKYSSEYPFRYHTHTIKTTTDAKCFVGIWLQIQFRISSALLSLPPGQTQIAMSARGIRGCPTIDCDECGKQSSRQDSLKRHLRIGHDTKVWEMTNRPAERGSSLPQKKSKISTEEKGVLQILPSDVKKSIYSALEIYSNAQTPQQTSLYLNYFVGSVFGLRIGTENFQFFNFSTLESPPFDSGTK